MKGIKLTPLLLFVLLLIVLVISVVFGNLNNTEGFIAFQKDKSPLDKVWIPQYSKNETVYKLNDNMFFDNRNGNFIELDAEQYSEAAIDKMSQPPTTNSHYGDAAIIITKSGVETAVKTAAPFVQDFAMKNGALLFGGQGAGTIPAILPAEPVMAPVVPPEPVMAPVVPAEPVMAPVIPSEPVMAPVIPAEPVMAPVVPAEPVMAPVVQEESSVPADTSNQDAAAAAKAAAAVAVAVADAAAVGATTDGFTNQIDRTGVTITSVIVTPRDGSPSSIYNVTPNNTEPTDTLLSKKTNVDSSYKSWSYESQCANTTNKTVLYMPWKENTYIIIVDKECNEQQYSVYMFGLNNVVEYKSFSKKDVLDIYSQQPMDETVNKVVNEPTYTNKPVYKLSKNVAYDITNGNVVIIPTQGEAIAKVFTRNGVEVVGVNTPETTSVSSVGFQPWIINVDGKMAGLYMPYQENTVICILKENGKIGLANVKRFTPTNVDINETAQPIIAEQPAAPPAVADVSTDSNYILKTQIVPPVCPTCPACPDKVTCTNCGGQGGSGTLTANGKSIVGKKGIRDEDEGEDLIRGAVSGADGLVRGAVSGADDLVRDAASGTAGLARDAVSGTTGLARDAVSGTVGLARDAVSGATGLLKDTASGVAGIFRTNPTYPQTNIIAQGSMNPYLQSNSGRRPRANGGMVGPQVTDNSTYFGALPERMGTNYMPITANFSTFSR